MNIEEAREELAKLKAEKAAFSIPVEPNVQQSNAMDLEGAKEELQRLKEIKSSIHKPVETKVSKDKSFSWPTYLLQQVGKGALSLADLAMMIVNPDVASEENFLRLPWKYDPSKEAPLPSTFVPDTEKPTTQAQRIAGNVARGVGAGAIPLGMAATIPNALKGALFGGTAGGGSGALQEAGVPAPVADVAGILGAGALSGIPKTIAASKGLSEEEKRVAKYIREHIPEQESKEIAARLANKSEFPVSGYEPMTAEVASSPFISQHHRLRYEIPGSGLPQRAATNREALNTALEERSLKPISADEVREGLKETLKKRKEVRKQETTPLYEGLRERPEALATSNTSEFLNKQKVAGDLRKDLEWAKKEFQETFGKGSLSDEAYKKIYENASHEIRKGLKSPETPKAEVGRLDAFRQAINSRIENLPEGAKNRKNQLLRLRESLDRDLESFPMQKEITQKYAKLSEPVSEIEKHKDLVKIIKSKSNTVMPAIFNKNSKDNVEALKKAFAEDPKSWNQFQDATIKYIEKSISNAGAEGARTSLSYPKMKSFLEQHGDAVKEVLTADQLKFLDELKQAVHGQNIAKTLGKGEGSPTHARLATELGMKKSLGIKATEAASHLVPSKLGGAPLRYFLNRWMQNRDADVMKALDAALLDPDVAKKLFSETFETQRDFNKYLNQLILTTSKEATSKDEE